jgi:hypothetical protein
MVINMFLIMLACGALGVGPEEGKAMGWFIGLAFFSVIKDLYLMFYAFGLAREGGSVAGEFAGDFLLFIWGAVAYTSTWVYMSKDTPLVTGGSPLITSLEVFAALFIFFIFFLPIQVVYLQEEASLPKNWKRSLFFWLGFGANVVCAMLMLVSNSAKW